MLPQLKFAYKRQLPVRVDVNTTPYFGTVVEIDKSDGWVRLDLIALPGQKVTAFLSLYAPAFDFVLFVCPQPDAVKLVNKQTTHRPRCLKRPPFTRLMSKLVGRDVVWQHSGETITFSQRVLAFNPHTGVIACTTNTPGPGFSDIRTLEAIILTESQCEAKSQSQSSESSSS